MSDPLAFGAPAEEGDLVDLQLGGGGATAAAVGDPLLGGDAAPAATTAAAATSAAAADPLLGGGAAAVPAAVVERPASAWDAFASGVPAAAVPVAASPAAPAAAAPPPPAYASAAAAPAPAAAAPTTTAARPPTAAPPLLVVQVGDPVRREGPGAGGFFGAAAGGGAHVEYLVTTATSAPGGLPGWRAPTVSVRRRFRDAVALADLLKTTHRGYFVPPRPDKNAAEGGVSLRQTDGFIQERRAALERWLNRLAAHPAVGPSDALRVFLEAEGDLSRDYRWLALQPPPAASVLEGASRAAQQLLGRESRAVDPVAAAQPAARSMDLLRAVREAATQARAPGGALAAAAGSAGGSLASSAYMGQAGGGGDAGGAADGHAYGGGSALLREGGGMPDGEAALRAARARAEDVREALAAASRAAEALVAAQEGCAQGAAELGAALFRLARLEEGAPGAVALAAAAGNGGGDADAAAAAAAEVAGALVADPKRAAGACVRAGKLRERAVARSAADLGKLHEWLALMPAVSRGLASREHQLLTAATLQDDLAQRRAQLAALDPSSSAGGAGGYGGGPAAGGGRRAEDLRADAARLELSCAAARREYDRLAAINRAELARASGERAAELGAMMEGCAATQAAAAERSLEIWLALAQELRCAPERLAPLRSALTAMGGAI